MKYVIMCGGDYDTFEIPKQLTVVNGETLVDRTIRLLKENGITDIYISTNDDRFRGKSPLLKHYNSYKVVNEVIKGYWLDAFYPGFAPSDKVTYLFGDVYYSEKAIKTIIESGSTGNVLVGNSVAMNPEHHNIGEPFAYIVNDYKTFMEGIRKVKELFREGKVKRNPLVWELYRYLNELDINIQDIQDNYIAIDDETIDVDTPEEAEKLANNDSKSKVRW